MNFADLETMWRSPHNQPLAAELEKQKMHFVTALRRRRRGHVLFLITTALPLVVLTGFIVRHLLVPQPEHPPVDWQKEWAVIPLYLLPWAGWLFLVRLHFRHCAEHRDYTQSVRASLTALLDENGRERARYTFIGTLLVVCVPLLVLVVHQLRSVGKAGPEIVLPGFVLGPALLLGIALWMLVYLRTKLGARRRELEALLASYPDTAASPSSSTVSS